MVYFYTTDIYYLPFMIICLVRYNSVSFNNEIIYNLQNSIVTRQSFKLN